MSGSRGSTKHSPIFFVTSVCAVLLASLSELPLIQLPAASGQEAPGTKADTPADSGVKPRGKRNIRDMQLSGWRKVCFRSVACGKSMPYDEQRDDGHGTADDPFRSHRSRSGRRPNSDAASRWNVLAIRRHFDGGPERTSSHSIQLVPRKRVRCRGARQPKFHQRPSIRPHFDGRGCRSKSVDDISGAAAGSVRPGQRGFTGPAFRQITEPQAIDRTPSGFRQSCPRFGCKTDMPMQPSDVCSR